MVYDLLKPDIIDINYGCPVPKVTKRGAGSAALKDLCLMDDITCAVVEAVPKIPVTVKMRAGWDQDSMVSTEAGIRVEKNGVAAITLHPRTTKQQFTGKSDWSKIKELKESVAIPVIGNGDVQNADDYFRMLNETKCDAVMIGRAALGNPWIFKAIQKKLLNEDFNSPSINEKINICKKHFELLKSDKTERLCVNLAKKHFSFYLKGFSGASEWRKKFMKTNDCLEISNLLIEMKEQEFYTA